MYEPIFEHQMCPKCMITNRYHLCSTQYLREHNAKSGRLSKNMKQITLPGYSLEVHITKKPGRRRFELDLSRQIGV